MKRWVMATLMVAGAIFMLIFGAALLPILIAVAGTAAGVALAFAPVIIIVLIIALVAHSLKDDKSK